VDNFLPFITLPIFTRILTPEDYGLLALAQIYAFFVTGIANFGLLPVYDRSYFQYAQDKLKSGQLFFSSIAFVILNYVILGVLTYLWREPLSALIIRSPQHGYLLFMAYCTEALMPLRQYYLFYLKNGEDAKGYARYYLISSVLTFLLSLLWVAGLRVGVIGIIYGRLLAYLLTIILLHQRIRQELPMSFDKGILWESLKISFPLTPRIVFGVMTTQFDKYLLGLLASTGGVGLYTIGQKIANIVFVYMTSLQNVFQPQVYKRLFELKEDAMASVGRYLTPFIYLSTALGIGVALFAEEAIWILTPPEYHGAVEVVIILSMYFGFLFFGKINPIQLFYSKKTGVISSLMLMTFVFNVLICIPLIQKWGVVGAAWGTFSVALISGGVSFYLAQRCCPIGWEYGKMGKIFGVFFGSAILVVLLRAWQLDYTVRLFVKVGLLIFYGYSGIRWKIISKENFSLVKKIILPRAEAFKEEVRTL
jgi:O-antigen/teichoic acid export membrane protein